MIECGNGATIVSILSDMKAFWNYDNREQFMADPTLEDEDA